METILYFAYGSNMLLERLQERCKSARRVQNAWVEGYAIAFSKKSVDESGKATLVVADVASRMHGVIFALDAGELGELDRAEGAGYQRHENFIVQAAGSEPTPISVITYIARADAIDPARMPYDWYLQLAVAGALENGLPDEYVTRLRSTQAVPDPELNRKSRKDALVLLKTLGRSG